MPPKNGKSSSNNRSANKVDKMVTESSQDIAAAIERAFSSGPSAIHVPSKRQKRKPSDLEPDSDIEIVEGPATPSPSKKKREILGNPDAPAGATKRATPKMATLLEMIDSVVVMGTGVDPPSASSRLSLRPKGKQTRNAQPHGSLEASTLGAPLTIADAESPLESAPALLSPAGRPIRLKSKSEKARLAEQSASPIKPVKKTLEQVQAKAALMAAERESYPGTNIEHMVTMKSDDPSFGYSEDDLPDVNTMFSPSSGSSRAKGSRFNLPDSDKESIVDAPQPAADINPFMDVEAQESDGNSEEGRSGDEVLSEADSAQGASDAQSQSDVGASDAGSDASVGNATVSQTADDVDFDAVMQPSLWDDQPGLIQDYKQLPFLKTFYDIAPYSDGGRGDVESQRCSLESVSQEMPVAAIAYFVAGLKFVRSGCYVNTARVDPRELVVDPAGRLRIADGRRPLAIGIMMGVVSESSLFTPVMNTARTPTNIHRISIAPMSQEFRRDTSVWGLLFKFPQPVIMGPTSGLGFSFSTYGEGRGPQSFQTARAASSTNAPTTPQKKKSSITFSVKSPVAAQAMAISANPIAYEDTVPVYDGRPSKTNKGFAFTDADFLALAKWPRFLNNDTELPNDSVVAVGYTVKTYGSGTVYLSSNVQFVIVLSAPGFNPASGSEKAVARKRGAESG